jgi:hypothetical protein
MVVIDAANGFEICANSDFRGKTIECQLVGRSGQLLHA